LQGVDAMHALNECGPADLRRIAMSLLPRLAEGKNVLRAESIISSKLFHNFSVCCLRPGTCKFACTRGLTLLSL
jgi:hypothetical protein